MKAIRTLVNGFVWLTAIISTLMTVMLLTDDNYREKSVAYFQGVIGK